ncbi:MAG: methionyl-tRNA formyltransferase [Candidatus Handelsmanbacteria bacterium RIFCSPLOWO2_12_FULL_64_10]|uniref:Methionyl-tRNA formyltransferase n=1 Tax=Handelsmanbacteria sp. (strain RIFCSPLOWO2_12_FULL_64_10) TaxID=1817868 RepID=A0A1F6CSX2_HANXR|nr:MAG: methionyl-tRNA formyltransferase [Candidatus Handelsmanbacteria bacterium RIFCSPLOWO2_12_FULL_64_10]
MGTPDFAVPSLHRLAQSEHPIVAVVTRPDAPQGRGRAFAPPPVKLTADAFGIPALQPEVLSDPGFLGALKAYAADLFVVVAFPILPVEVLKIPRQGSINLHASLLPRYRGAAPVQRAVMAGEKETGLTTFLLTPKMDAGDILMQRRVEIGPEETAGELADRMKRIGADLLAETVDGLASGSLAPVPQPSEGATKAPKLTREDGRIDWSRDAGTLRNLIRGTNPEPGAFTTWRGGLLKVHRAAVAPPAPPGQRGEIVSADAADGVTVATAEGGLRLTEVQLPGKRRLTGAEWVRGYRLQVGEMLGV